MTLPYVIVIVVIKVVIKMHRCKIFNFLVMWMETEVLIQKFIKPIEMGMNIRNFTKWIKITVNI